MRKSKTIFITATDTHVGKTITTFVLGALCQSKGVSVGVLKPVQCAGRDSAFLKKSLGLKDDLSLINPCFAPEALSPHLALRRAKRRFDLKAVQRAHRDLSARYELLLVEGAGGLMVPLSDTYYNADLAGDLNAEIIIVSRLGLGTINHTLLTINQAKAYGLKIKGLIFSDAAGGKQSLAAQTNPREITRLSGIPVLGIIPHLKTMTKKNVLTTCAALNCEILLA